MILDRNLESYISYRARHDAVESLERWE